MRDGRLQRRGLAEVSPEEDDSQARHALLQAAQQVGRAVLAAVVHHHDLVVQPKRIAGAHDLVDERLDVARLVVHGKDDGQLHGRQNSVSATNWR